MGHSAANNSRLIRFLAAAVLLSAALVGGRQRGTASSSCSLRLWPHCRLTTRPVRGRLRRVTRHPPPRHPRRQFRHCLRHPCPLCRIRLLRRRRCPPYQPRRLPCPRLRHCPTAQVNPRTTTIFYTIHSITITTTACCWAGAEQQEV